MKTLAALALATAFLASGCFRTTVRSGQPPGAVPNGYDERWHHGYVAGAIEGSGPYALDQLCPGGWAEVKAKTDPLDSLLWLVTLTIYSPQVTTIVCSEPGGTMPPPPDGYRVPPQPSSVSAYPPPGNTYPPAPPAPDQL